MFELRVQLIGLRGEGRRAYLSALRVVGELVLVTVGCEVYRGLMLRDCCIVVCCGYYVAGIVRFLGV